MINPKNKFVQACWLHTSPYQFQHLASIDLSFAVLCVVICEIFPPVAFFYSKMTVEPEVQEKELPESENVSSDNSNV